VSRTGSRLWNSLTFRILAPVLVGFVLGFLMSEGPALWIDDPTSRPTRTVELIIPAGTAERIAGGEAAPAIPDGLNLATGDTLLVRNEDDVSHQLGPMWIPAGTTGSLVFPRSVAGRYSCSFTPAGTFGIQVDQRLTDFERFVFVLVSGLPFAAVLTLVSVFLWYSQKTTVKPGGSEPAPHRQ
jgi:hypothetical protein